MGAPAAGPWLSPGLSDGLNRFYLDTPYLDWMVHFELPPNHFDDYLPALAIQEQKASARERAILREISEKRKPNCWPWPAP